jgi:acetyltransferase-like isoleucine patch superfamily enzyme
LNQPFIHERALVEEGAVIGGGSKVCVNSQVRSGARIGNDCVLGKDTFVDSGVRIGDRVKIQNGVSVYSGVSLGDDILVGPNAVFTNDRFPRATNEEWPITETIVERGASIGANATLVCGIRVGHHAMIGAGSVVTRDVPPHALVLGNPARLQGYVCACGTRAEPGEACGACGTVLRLEPEAR